MSATVLSNPGSPSPDALGRCLFLAVLLLSAGLLVWNLGQRPLWADEAETALLARNILESGVPHIVEGQSWVYPRLMGWVNDEDVWIWSPWLDEYVTAGSFALAGESEWSARLPFVLAGLATFLVAGWIVKQLTGDWLSASATAVLLLGSPVILHHIRQCRYYALSMLAVVVLAWGVMRWKEGRRAGGPIIAGSIFALMMMLPTIGVVCMSALLLYVLLFAGSVRGGFLLLAWTGLGGVLALPWYLWARPVHQMNTVMLAGYGDRLSRYLLSEDAHFIPGVIFGFVLFIWLAQAGWRRSGAANGILVLLGSIFLGNVLLISAIGYEAFRYLVPTAPIPAVMTMLLLRGIGLHGWLTITVATFLAVTNIASIQTWRGMPPERLGDYIWERTLPYEEDVRLVAQVIKEEGSPTDTVMVVDEELPLAFLLGNRLELGLDPVSLKVDSLVGLWDHINRHPVVAVMPRDQERLPDWIVSRSVGRSIVGRHELQMPHGWARHFEAMVVEVPAQRNDGSDPDPRFYQRSMTGAKEKLTIYRRRAIPASDTPDDR